MLTAGCFMRMPGNCCGSTLRQGAVRARHARFLHSAGRRRWHVVISSAPAGSPARYRISARLSAASPWSLGSCEVLASPSTCSASAKAALMSPLRASSRDRTLRPYNCVARSSLLPSSRPRDAHCSSSWRRSPHCSPSHDPTGRRPIRIFMHRRTWGECPLLRGGRWLGRLGPRSVGQEGPRALHGVLQVSCRRPGLAGAGSAGGGRCPWLLRWRPPRPRYRGGR